MIENILLILFLLILSAKIVGSVFGRMGLDSSVGELLIGIIVGPSVLKLISPSSVEEFAIIGSVLILFIAGMKQQSVKKIFMDKLAREIGLKLFFVTSILMGVFFYVVPHFFGITFSLLQVIILAIAFSIIDVGVPAKVMISKGLINSPVGRITIRSAIVNIVLGLLVFTFSSLFIDFSLFLILTKLVGIGLFVLIITALFSVMTKLSPFVARLHVEEAEFSLAIILVLLLAYLSEFIGFSSVLGAFLAGQIIGSMPFSETRSFTDKIKSISFGLFVPLFFVWFGLSIDLVDIWKNIGLGLLIFLAYVSIRFVLTYYLIKKNKLDHPLLVSSSMLSVDVESLVVLIIAMKIGIFSNSIPLSLFAPSVLLSTLFIVLMISAISFFDKKKSPVAAKSNKRSRS